MTDQACRSFLHIGFGKCASTTLQSRVFPAVASAKGYNYLLTDEVGFFAPDGDAIITSGDDPDSRLVLGSDERIIGRNPGEWRLRADRLRSKFGSDMRILIIIREPKSYFRSVYQQDALHQLPIRTVDEFFLGRQQSASKMVSGVKVKDFDYDALIAIFRVRFDHVVVQKFESVLRLDFLREFMPLTDAELDALRIGVRRRPSNRSYSASASALTLKMAGFLNSNLPEPNELGRIPKTRRSRLWRMLMRDFYDSIVPYRKFEIDWSKDVFNGIDELCSQYAKLPDIQVLRG